MYVIRYQTCDIYRTSSHRPIRFHRLTGPFSRVACEKDQVGQIDQLAGPNRLGVGQIVHGPNRLHGDRRAHDTVSDNLFHDLVLDGHPNLRIPHVTKIMSVRHDVDLPRILEKA